jgi:hypothetical protein
LVYTSVLNRTGDAIHATKPVYAYQLTKYCCPVS